MNPPLFAFGLGAMEGALEPGEWDLAGVAMEALRALSVFPAEGRGPEALGRRPRSGLPGWSRSGADPIAADDRLGHCIVTTVLDAPDCWRRTDLDEPLAVARIDVHCTPGMVPRG